VASGARSIVLVGWSMGAMIGTLLLQNSRLSDRVVGLVMVAPVTSWRTVVAHAVRAARLPAIVGPLVEGILRTPGLCRLAALGAPVRLRDLDSAATRVNVPTLVIHNPGDPIAPFAASVDFVKQNGEHAQLVVFEEAPHAMEWNREPQRFEETMTRWVADVVARDRAAAGEEERP
jgi:pimeloyl-ACP methyl ester carboxylesterase